MASLKYEIPLLDRNTRFALWQIKMQAVLAQMDLEDALLGIDKMPSTLTDEEKKRKDRKALTQLHLHLSNEILQDVMKEKTAAALWKRLEQICMSKTLTSKLHMKQRLYAHRLEEGASVHEHLTVFKEILSNLEAMEVQYDKEDLGLILLCSLPPSYSTFRDTILYSRESLTVDEGEGLIVRGRQDRNTDDDRGRTQERNHRGKSKGRSKSSNRGKTCNFCKKKGHIKSECYKLQNKIKREAANQKGKQPENSGEADVVEDYSDGELLVASVNDSKVSEEWILDSGCTFHMSPNRDWFTTYETVSVSEGYRYTAEVGGLKISKGSLVVMKGQRKTAQVICFAGFYCYCDAAMVRLSKRGLLDGQGICKLNFCEHCVLGSKREFDSLEGSITRRKRWSIFILIYGDHPECLRETGKQIKYLRTDNGLEFCSDEFNRLCKSEGIVRDTDSSSYSTAKRRCRTNEQNDHGEGSMYVVKCQLTEVVLGRSSLYCMFLINRSPSVAIEKKTPQEVWSGNPANYSDLKIFGCPAKVVISRDVVFDETAMLPNLSLKTVPIKNQKQVEHQINTESTPQSVQKLIIELLLRLNTLSPKNRTKREIKPPKKYAEADLVAYALNVAEDIDANQEPSNYSEAISCEDSEKWMLLCKRGWNHSTKTKHGILKLPKGKKTSVPGVDFTDVFSPVVKHSSIRALLGIVAMHDLELEQLDVKTAFLHGELEEDIYMQQPEGFYSFRKRGYVCLLKKSLYGLKQSPRQWYKRFDSFMTSHDFKRSSFDTHFRLSSALSPQSDDEIEYMSHVPYSSAVGSLMYAMVCSRPDLSYAVSAVSRYMANPGKEHWKAVQWILRYLRGTTDVCLQFGRTEDGVIGYVDADFAGDLDRRRSLTGYVFTIGGCAISWKATLQTTVALSTTEAEYMAITEACKELFG
ncbi:hypothetical protein CXB51_026062 [Gossypium anomalum]|uniref:Reverse transcriptase Ty1/copia-type domain-containing protein n=1 Tax=Gossypium anomalum TaxID=47600 RepID=A0A8J6CN92_9ROSI|nr:hypothetical protein CXB51_026062 [Gossypium anomalum]